MNDPTNVTPKIIVNNGVITTCTGGGVTGGTFTVRAHFNEPTNCKILLTGAPTTNPPTGKIFTTWNTGQLSTAKITLKQVSGDPTKTHVVGKVVAGLFLGLHVDQTLSFAPKSGDCASTQLKSVTFKEVTALKIS